jgi:dynein heavy chain
VTDGHDYKTLLSILSVLYTPNIVDDDYKFSASGIYYAPSDYQYAYNIEFIKELPAITKPEAFGLHENVDITKDHKEADELLSTVEATQVRFFFPLPHCSSPCSAPHCPITYQHICFYRCVALNE